VVDGIQLIAKTVNYIKDDGTKEIKTFLDWLGEQQRMMSKTAWTRPAQLKKNHLTIILILP
jgi:hypothetical protein